MPVRAPAAGSTPLIPVPQVAQFSVRVVHDPCLARSPSSGLGIEISALLQADSCMVGQHTVSYIGKGRLCANFAGLEAS